MNQERPQMNPEELEALRKQFPSLGEKRAEKVDESAVLGTLALVGIGAFAAKKFWGWKGGEIEKRASPIVDQAIDKVLNHAKGKLFGAIDSAFEGGKMPDKKMTPKPERSTDKGGDKKVFEDGLSDLGVDIKGAMAGKEDAVINDVVLDKLQTLSERFGTLADEDPAFAAEVNALSIESQEEIMSFVRKLDPDTRGKISLAFLSGNLEASEEAAGDIREKSKSYEYISAEEMTKDEAYDLVKKIIDREENLIRVGSVIPQGHRLYDYLRRSTRDDPEFRDYGEDSMVDNIGYGAFNPGARNDKYLGLIVDSITKFAEENPIEAKILGIASGEQVEQEADNLKPDRMKEEYKRLLKERYTVQKVTLKIMADFLRAKK